MNLKCEFECNKYNIEYLDFIDMFTIIRKLKKE